MTSDQLVRAIQGDLCACYRSFRGLGEAQLRDDDEMLYMSLGMGGMFFNCVAWARSSPVRADDQIEQTLAHFRSRRTRMRWWVGPLSQPPDLAARLVAHGMTQTRDVPGMALDISAMNDSLPAPDGLHIEHVQDQATLVRWEATLTRGFVPGTPTGGAWLDIYSRMGVRPEKVWQHFLASKDGKDVAVTSLFRGPEVAGIYHVVTVEEARRQGIGSAVTIAALKMARQLGYKIAVLQASAMGAPIYAKIGFQEACKLGCYVLT